MPCSGPSDAECRGADAKVTVAKHIVFFFGKMGVRVPVWVTDTIENSGWGVKSAGIDELTSYLCDAIQTASVHEAHAIIYNAKSRDARDLANWWEDHQKLDTQREEKEAQELADKAEREEVLNSLTDYQRAVLFPND